MEKLMLGSGMARTIALEKDFANGKTSERLFRRTAVAKTNGALQNGTHEWAPFRLAVKNTRPPSYKSFYRVLLPAEFTPRYVRTNRFLAQGFRQELSIRRCLER